MTARHRFALVIGLMTAAMSLSAAAQTPAPAPAPNAGPVYVITFFETGAATAAKAIAQFRPYAAATRKQDGNQGFLALQEIARPSRFAIVEVWRDKPAVEAHAAALAALRDQLQPLLTSPFDTRTNYGLSVAGPAIGAEPGGGNPVYVLTHVDVFPPGKDQTIDLLKQLADASRKESGNLRFDVLQQEGRANHLPLVEAWRDEGAERTCARRAHARVPREARAIARRALRRAALHASALSQLD